MWVRMAWMSVVFGGCTAGTSADGPADLAGRESLGAVDAVAAFDPDGDGVDEVVTVSGDVLRWSGGEAELPGRFQRYARGDIDGDGDEELLIAVGTGRGHRDAIARVIAVHGDRTEELWTHDGPRNQVPALAVLDHGVFIAVFIKPKVSRGGWLEGGSLTGTIDATMAMAWAPLSRERVAVGRLYGERPGTDGGLDLVDKGASTVLTSLRGVRALGAGDLDGDGGQELVVGDGWHASYGKEADPRVALFTGADRPVQRTIGFLDGDYAANQIEIAGAGPKASVVIRGNRRVFELARDDLGWSTRVVSDVPETGNIAVVRTASGWQVAMSGPQAALAPLVGR